MYFKGCRDEFQNIKFLNLFKNAMQMFDSKVCYVNVVLYKKN